MRLLQTGSGASHTLTHKHIAFWSFHGNLSHNHVFITPPAVLPSAVSKIMVRKSRSIAVSIAVGR